MNGSATGSVPHPARLDLADRSGQALGHARALAKVDILGFECRILGAEPFLVLDCPELYLREGGGPYQTDDGRDWDDNALRFGVFSRAAALLGGEASPLGWRPQVPFESGLAKTVAWYRSNEWWWRPIKEQDAAYKAYYAAQYGSRPRA